jgi:hypothetical protein
MRIATAGNVEVPAYSVILSKGYTVERQSEDLLVAKKDGNSYLAEDAISLLGIVMVGELRGEDWHATDDEIDGYLKQVG